MVNTILIKQCNPAYHKKADRRGRFAPSRWRVIFVCAAYQMNTISTKVRFYWWSG